MIKITNLNDLKKYFALPDAAVEFLKNATTDTENGKHPFNDDCYINVMSPTTVADDNALMEAHREFVDVQFIIEGEERMLYTDIDATKVETPYNAAKDALFCSFEKADAVCVAKGEAVVFYPQDAHLPCRAVNEPMTIKKAVMKVRYQK